MFRINTKRKISLSYDVKNLKRFTNQKSFFPERKHIFATLEIKIKFQK